MGTSYPLTGQAAMQPRGDREGKMCFIFPLRAIRVELHLITRATLH